MLHVTNYFTTADSDTTNVRKKIKNYWEAEERRKQRITVYCALFFAGSVVFFLSVIGGALI